MADDQPELPGVAEPKKKAKKPPPRQEPGRKPKIVPPCKLCGSADEGDHRYAEKHLCSSCARDRSDGATDTLKGLVAAGKVTLETDVDALADFAVRVGEAMARRMRR